MYVHFLLSTHHDSFSPLSFFPSFVLSLSLPFSLQSPTNQPPFSIQFLNRPLPLYVYNHEYNVTRPITITPSRSWGGDGALGCVLGFGALHRIPAPLEEPPQAPGETLFASSPHTSFDEKRGAEATIGAGLVGNELFVPAEMGKGKSPPPPPSAATSTSPQPHHPPPKRKARAHHAYHTHAQHDAGTADASLDDYFREGEIKSQEQDRAPKPKGDVPPPPKMGGAGPPPRGPPPKGGPPRSGTGTPVQGGGGEGESKTEGEEDGKS